MSSAADGSPDAHAVGVHVIERDVDPLRQALRRLLVAAKGAELPTLEERVDRLPRDAKQIRGAARRDEPPPVLLEEEYELRITAGAIGLRHRQTIVAWATVHASVRPRSPPA